MATLELSIEATMLGPASVGTIDHIHVLRSVGRLSLSQAKRVIDRCVGGEVVQVAFETPELAAQVAAALNALPAAPRTKATVRD